MSVNVVQETAAALKLFDSMEGVAYELGISVAGLTYRLNNNPSLMEIAISRGLYKPRKKVVEPKPAQAITAANVPEPEPAQEDKPSGKRRREGTHRMEVNVPDDLYANLERQAKRDMRPVSIQALWIIKQALSAVEIER